MMKLVKCALALALIVLFLALVVEAGKNFYDILGVPKTASESEIKRAYKKLAVKYHPDKNKGNKEAEAMFIEIANAYEVLSDPQKKQTYDLYGEEGLKNQGQHQHHGFGDAADIFSQFFGGAFSFGGGFGGGSHNAEEDLKGPDLTVPLDVTLEDLYNGQVFEIVRTRPAHKEGATPRKCECKNKRVTMTIQMGGVIKQVLDNNCEECRDRFDVITKTTSLLVDVERGMTNGQQIRFYGEGDASREKTAGDLIFVIRTRPHKTFERRGNDLYTKMRITLKEALVGFTKTIRQLDGRDIPISNQPNQVIKPGMITVVHGEGMPVYNSHDGAKGNLFIEFDVEFPPTLTNEQIEKIKETL